MRCYFKSTCDNPMGYVCCNECTIKECWQRCKDDPQGCGLVDDSIKTVEVIYYNVVNRVGKTKFYIKNGEFTPIRDGEETEGLPLVELAQNEAENFIQAMNGKGRKVWSLIETRREIVELER